MLEQQEGDHPLGQLAGTRGAGVNGNGASAAVLRILQSWVYEAAAIAPARTGDEQLHMECLWGSMLDFVLTLSFYLLPPSTSVPTS